MPDVPLPPGYVLVERLGSGGFATVWLAEQGRLGRRVAIKVLGETLEDSERERRFLAECRAIGRLSGHPAVVTVHDAGTTDSGHPYLVMEHLPGGSLHDRVSRQGPVPWVEVLRIGVQVADALAAAHDAGILHRDVKPANVLVDENGAPKLGDFGIARLSEGTNTATGALVGTIPFTPPEVLSGHRPGPTADIWSLGATLHALLSGSSPFGGNRDEPPAAAIARVLRSEPPPLGPEVPAALRDLISAMLAADPADRPQTAAAVVMALQVIQADRGLEITPARATRAAPTSEPIGTTDATAVGLPALDTPAPSAHPSPPPPPPPPTPVPGVASPVPPPPGPLLGKADAPTGGPATWEPPVASPTPPPPPPLHDPATAVLPSTGPTPGAHPPPGPTGPAPTGAPPPPPRRDGSGRGKGVLVGVGVLVVVLLVGAVVAALVLGGGGDGDAADGPDDTVAGQATEPGGTPVDGEPASAEITTNLGIPAVVASGPGADPSDVWSRPASCVPPGANRANPCGAVAVDGDVVTIVPGEGGSVLRRASAADDTEVWARPVDVGDGLGGLTEVGETLVVSADFGDVRRYQTFTMDGTPGASVELALDDRPALPNPQPAQGTILVVLIDTGEVALLDTAGGGSTTVPGLVVASDADTLWADVDGQLVAYSLPDGAEVARTAEVDPTSIPTPEVPYQRAGVLAGGRLHVATAAGLAVVDPDTLAVTTTVPYEATDGAALGEPLAVSAVGDLVVVATTAGDMALDGATGELRWAQLRDPLLLPSDDDGSVWVGSGTRLVVGLPGSGLQAVDLGTGEVVAPPLALSSAVSASTVVPYAGGIAVLDKTTVTGYSLDDLQPQWTASVASGATGLMVAEGGIVVVTPTGITGLQG